MRSIIAALALSLSASFGAHALSKEVLACYSVCNKTVSNGSKRNACFKDCRDNAGAQATASGSGDTAGSSSANAAPAAEGNVGKKLTADDRKAAEAARTKAEKTFSAKAGQCKSFCGRCGNKWHGEPNAQNCNNDCTAVLGMYNNSRAILSTGAKIKPGQSGHMSGKFVQSRYGGSYNEIEQAKAGMEREMAACQFEAAVPYMQTIDKEWTASLKASRRQND